MLYPGVGARLRVGPSETRQAAEGKLKLGKRLHERLLLAQCLDAGVRERIHDAFQAALKHMPHETASENTHSTDVVQRVNWILDETVASLYPGTPRATPPVNEAAPRAEALPTRPLHAIVWLEMSRTLFKVALPFLTESFTRDTDGPSCSDVSAALEATIQTSVYRASGSYVETMLARVEAATRTQITDMDRQTLEEAARESRSTIMRKQLIQGEREEECPHSGPIVDSVTHAIRRASAEIDDSELFL